MSHQIASGSSVRTLAVTFALIALLAACDGPKPDVLVASAKEYLAKEDPKAAIIQLKNALQENVNLPEARYLLGVALLRTGDAAGSEAELRKARDYKHPDDEVVPPLAEAMLALKQYRNLTDEFAGVTLPKAEAQARLQTTVATAFAVQRRPQQAREALEAALKANPTYTTARLMQVRDQSARRDFDTAITNLDAIILAAPTEHVAWKLKGDVLWYGKQQANEAMVAYRKAVELKPDFVEGHIAILDQFWAQGSLDDAEKQLDLLKKVAPNELATKFHETLLAYGKKDLKRASTLSQQLVQAAPEHVRSQLLAGEIALASNAPAQAIGPLSDAVRLAPQSIRARRMLVRAYLGAGRPAKALGILQPMLSGDKADPVTNRLAGEVYLLNGDPKKAQEYFAKAAQQDPKSTRARISLALVRMADSNEDWARGDLQQIALADKGVTADLALISSFLARRDFDKALKAIDAMEKKQPEKPQAAMLRARVLLAKKDFAGARKSFERALALDSAHFSAVAGLAALDLFDKKPDDARKRLEVALALHPKDPQALVALAELRERTGGSKEEVAGLFARAVTANPTEKQSHLMLVEFHMRNQDYKLAVAAAQGAVVAIPDSPELLDALGLAQQASGDNNQALTSFGKLASLQPESVLPLMRLANVQMASGNKDAAASSLRKALSLKPDLMDAQRGLINLAMEATNYTEALAVARNVQKQRPKDVAGHVFEGDIAAAQKKWDVALNAYRQGLKIMPAPILAIKIHSVLGASGKANEADRFAASWLKEQPKDISLRLYLGDQADARGDLATAEKMYASVVEIQPQNALALNNLAWVTGKQGKDSAIVIAEKAVALDPRQAAYLDTLAMLLLKKNDYAKALEWQNKAVLLQPQAPLFRLNLAKILILSGRKDLARKELGALVVLGDKFGGQPEVESLLKGL